MAKKTTPRSLVVGAWKLTSVDGQLQKLKDLGRENLQAIIALEQDGASAITSETDGEINRRAVQLMNGSAPPRSSAPAPTISELHIDKKAIEIAVRTLEAEQTAQRMRQRDALMGELAGEWRDLVRELAETVCKLRGINKRRADFRRALPGARLPWDEQRLLGDGSGASNEADQFLEALLGSGVVTNSEIKSWIEK